MHRAFILLVVALAVGVSTSGQQRRPATNAGSSCGDGSVLRYNDNFAEFYLRAVYDSFQPPDWKKAQVKISVHGASELRLSSDTDKFQLAAYSTTPRNINKYLTDLSDSCRLPATPSEAAALIKVKWESANISSAQFEQIHLSLLQALSSYVSSAQQRSAPPPWHAYLDATLYHVVYDNSYEHIEAEVVADPKQYKAMLDWIRQLQKLAEDTFHHSFHHEAPE